MHLCAWSFMNIIEIGIILIVTLKEYYFCKVKKPSHASRRRYKCSEILPFLALSVVGGNLLGSLRTFSATTDAG